MRKNRNRRKYCLFYESWNDPQRGRGLLQAAEWYSEVSQEKQGGGCTDEVHRSDDFVWVEVNKIL